ncbi:ESCRT-II complex vps25 subunit [Gautieria morchelliformis]|nr:ESCRT-II complex vps25 subunit [Gautieria morchelliformis]
MSLQTHRAASGFLLPSIHSLPPFFTLQPNPSTQAIQTQHWTRLILSYARHRRLFFLRVEDCEVAGSEWDEIFRNDRINRRLHPSHLLSLMESMVSQNMAVYEPPKQARAVILHWRLPEEWAEVLHEWVTSTGQLNTIMTFFEITSPPVESPLSGVPITVLRRALTVLGKTGRGQVIDGMEGGGVRFFPGTGKS